MGKGRWKEGEVQRKGGSGGEDVGDSKNEGCNMVVSVDVNLPDSQMCPLAAYLSQDSKPEEWRRNKKRRKR